MNKQADQPIPQGNYLPAIRHADLIYTSGMTPRKAGKLIFVGKVTADEPLGTYQDAVQLATRNALTAAQNQLADGESIAAVLQLSVFINAQQGFTQHAKLADFASDTLVEELGTIAIGSRAAIGVATLPSDAPVEITLVAAVKNKTAG